MGEERRSCAVPESRRETRNAGAAAEGALWGGPGFPGAERNEAETRLRPCGNGTLERPGAGRRSGKKWSKGKARSGGRE